MTELKVSYALIPAVPTCCICGKNIEKGKPFSKIISSSDTLSFLKGITVEEWAHPECIYGLAGKP